MERKLAETLAFICKVGVGSGASISQTGLVPASAVTIEFEAQEFGAGTLQVLIGGQSLALFNLGTGSNYTLYGADISAFANQVETLQFFALPVSGSSHQNDWTIDNIQFSSVAVPEPSELALATLGAILFGFCRRKSPA